MNFPTKQVAPEIALRLKISPECQVITIDLEKRSPVEILRIVKLWKRMLRSRAAISR